MRPPSHTEDILNPLLQSWDLPYGLPPFSQVVLAHFVPAFDLALQQHLAEIDAIAAQTAPPSFDNTVVALDSSGRLLDRITLLFHNLTASETSKDLQAVQLQMAPRLSRTRPAGDTHAAQARAARHHNGIAHLITLLRTSTHVHLETTRLC